MATNLHLTFSLAKTMAFCLINHAFVTKCLLVHNRTEIKFQKKTKQKTSKRLGLNYRFLEQVNIEYFASLLFFFLLSTVRIWNTENPKKNKTVIKTKNKQGGKIINVKKETVSDLKFFLLEN